MTLLMVGASHRSAPFGTLESLAAVGSEALLADVVLLDAVEDAVALVTCNRVELYVETSTPVTARHQVRSVLEGRAGHPLGTVLTELTDQAALGHLAEVAAGLQSLAIGESQILGQVRLACSLSREAGALGQSLSARFDQGMRIAKLVRRATDLDQLAPSVVSLALNQIPSQRPGKTLSVAVVGAGPMAALVAAAVTRREAGAEDPAWAELTIYNRSFTRGADLAERYDALARPLSELPARLAEHDIVIACTGSPQVQIDTAMFEPRTKPLQVIDLALPHDVDPRVAQWPEVTLLTLADLTMQTSPELASRLAQAQTLLDQELALLDRRDSFVANVRSQRQRVEEIIAEEIARLNAELSTLDGPDRDRVDVALKRTGDRLLHLCTVAARGEGRQWGHLEVVEELRRSAAQAVPA